MDYFSWTQLKAEQDHVQFCDRVKDEVYSKGLVRHLALIGGLNVKECVQRMTARIMISEHENIVKQDFQIAFGAAVPASTDRDIELRIAKHLNDARDREGRSKRPKHDVTCRKMRPKVSRLASTEDRMDSSDSDI